jgi:DNA-binding NarL/FixJ family response regulator
MTPANKSTSGKRTVRVCIIEDHAIVRAGIRMLIEREPHIEVIAEATTASEALSTIRDAPDVICST